MQKPQGVLFDYGDTLLTQPFIDREARIRRLLEMAEPPNGVAPETIQRLHEQLEPDVWPRCETSGLELPLRSYLRLVFETCGLRFRRSGEELELAFWQAGGPLDPEPGIEAALEALDARGVAMGIVSNTVFCAEVLQWELEKHGLGRYFRFLVSSAEYGLRKPHPALMNLAIKKMNLLPEQIWFVGDSERCDVGGAKLVGMTAIWYNRLGKNPEGPKPDLEIRGWEEFIKVYENSM